MPDADSTETVPGSAGNIATTDPGTVSVESASGMGKGTISLFQNQNLRSDQGTAFQHCCLFLRRFQKKLRPDSVPIQKTAGTVPRAAIGFHRPWPHVPVPEAVLISPCRRRILLSDVSACFRMNNTTGGRCISDNRSHGRTVPPSD